MQSEGAEMTNQKEAPSNQIELSIVLPCLNEERTVGRCVAQAMSFLARQKIKGEVLVADNGSTDRSAEIAKSNGAVVVQVDKKGYGNALKGGFEAARGIFIIIADADDSYDLVNLMPFVEKLRAGYDLVIGNRFKGGIKKGAMPWHHKYIGNPVLSFIGQLFFKTPVKDFHCGLRGFTKQAVEKMNLQTTGMELASEMVIKSSILGMRVCEVPTTLSPDGRDRRPHLRSFRDGWRHLRFLLIYSPRWLFFFPGLLLMLVGAVVSGWLLVGPRVVDGITLDVHTFLYAAMAIVIGYQTVIFAIFTKVFAITEGLLPEDPRLKTMFGYIKLETGILAGALLLVAGIGLSVYALSFWSSTSFGPLDPSRTLRLVIPAVTLIALGLQTVLSSFFLSILGLERH